MPLSFTSIFILTGLFATTIFHQITKKNVAHKSIWEVSDMQLFCPLLSKLVSEAHEDVMVVEGWMIVNRSERTICFIGGGWTSRVSKMPFKEYDWLHVSLPVNLLFCFYFILYIFYSLFCRHTYSTCIGVFVCFWNFNGTLWHRGIK